MFGNGLTRPEIWDALTDPRGRFRIRDVCEFYGATEGNCTISASMLLVQLDLDDDVFSTPVNYSNRRCAAGFVSLLLPSLVPVRLVKVDAETGDLVRRGPDNFCVACSPGQPGELVTPIRRGDPVRDYHGYVNDPDASKAKVVLDVFKKGDKYFRCDATSGLLQ